MTDYVEGWLQPAGPYFLLFPREIEEFDGYMIGRFTIRSITSTNLPAALKTRLTAGREIVLKGKIVSLHPAYRYLLRFRRAAKEDAEEYEVHPDAGFKDAHKMGWSWDTLRWSLENELCNHNPEAALAGIMSSLGILVVDALPHVIPEDIVAKQPWYPVLQEISDYYRMDALCKAREAWPSSVPGIRKLELHQLKALAAQLNERPHELCYYGYSRHYEGLGEMSFDSLKVLRNPRTTTPIILSAACFYDMLKRERIRFGHTAFQYDEWLQKFRARHAEYAHTSEGALHWLMRESHLLPVDDNGVYIERDCWYDEPSPLRWLMFPRDDRLKERILNHLRRIYANFLATSGAFTARDPAGPVVAAPRGPLNEGQRDALRHVLNNPMTIIQGGPGSGKTAFGAEHLSCIFQNIAVYTHVGRQAVSLADRLGGCMENASTIHSAHHRRRKPYEGPFRIKYAERVEIVVYDEVYNEDEWTWEASLALAQNASRVVFIGDPDQILPISGEEGAGTPALDLARAFPDHVITLNENMRQLANARAIHDVVTMVRCKRPREICWDSPTKAVERVDPPMNKSLEPLIPIMEPIIRRLRRGIGNDEHAWQIVTFFNGYKPDSQGLGVTQLNEIVERFNKRDADWTVRLKSACKITNRLTMYPGFKFVFKERYTPHSSLNSDPTGAVAPSSAAAGAAKRKPVARLKVLGPSGFYSESRNGQIEVVKKLRQVRIKGRMIWEVECEPKGRLKYGARFLLSRALHVDPSGIEAAWAITTNKAMGGECKNVAVYLPPGVAYSLFDRSNLYVALSRPIEYLSVVGRLLDIEGLTMKDPRKVTTGLAMRLRNATYSRPGESPIGLDWKQCHAYDLYGMINEDALVPFGDIYNQSQRVVHPKPMPLLGQSWEAFMAFEEKMLILRPDTRAHLDELCTQVRRKLYTDVVDHCVDIAPPWADAVPRLAPAAPPFPPMPGDVEPVTKRGRTAEAEDMSESL